MPRLPRTEYTPAMLRLDARRADAAHEYRYYARLGDLTNEERADKARAYARLIRLERTLARLTAC